MPPSHHESGPRCPCSRTPGREPRIHSSRSRRSDARSHPQGAASRPPAPGFPRVGTGHEERWGKEERLSLADAMFDDLPVLPGLHHDVALELDEELLAVHLVKIVPGVGAADDHREEVAAAVQILVANRGLEVIAMPVRPGHEVEGRRHGAIEFETVRFVRRVGIRDDSGSGGLGHVRFSDGPDTGLMCRSLRVRRITSRRPLQHRITSRDGR